MYHQALGRRKDSLFELLEATLAGGPRTSLVQRTLSPLFQRRWSSAPDALADGTLDREGGRQVIQPPLAEVPVVGRQVWAVDVTVWPRPAARTSPERTWGHRVTPGQPQEGVIPAWEYQWLVVVPLPGSSWVLPLEVERRGPQEASPTALALRQLRMALAHRLAPAPRPVVTFDSGYDAVAVGKAVLRGSAEEQVAVDALVRLPSRRRLYRQPPPYAGKGRPRVHGAVLRLKDPATHGTPDRSACLQDARHGQVQVDVWEHLHDQHAPSVGLTLVRVQAERLPRALKVVGPLWLVWVGERLPEDLLDLWHWYALRFTIEQGFRFLKQDLGWTAVRVRAPAAADRWSRLVALGLWELWLARGVVSEQRLPWERRLPPEGLPPGRVRRGLGMVLAAAGSPVRCVRPRGKSPGRQVGERPGPSRQHPVSKRQAATAA